MLFQRPAVIRRSSRVGGCRLMSSDSKIRSEGDGTLAWAAKISLQFARYVMISESVRSVCVWAKESNGFGFAG